MKYEHIAELARYYFPDAEVEVWPVPHLTLPENVRVYVSTLNPGSPWKPHESLDACAFAYPVLEERGLTGEYDAALKVCLNVLTPYSMATEAEWLSRPPTAPQSCAALVAVMELQQRTENND